MATWLAGRHLLNSAVIEKTNMQELTCQAPYMTILQNCQEKYDVIDEKSGLRNSILLCFQVR